MSLPYLERGTESTEQLGILDRDFYQSITMQIEHFQTQLDKKESALRLSNYEASPLQKTDRDGEDRLLFECMSGKQKLDLFGGTIKIDWGEDLFNVLKSFHA